MSGNGNDKLRTALGFAMKAGKVRSGEFAAEKAIKGGKARVLAVDSGASEQSKKHWSDMCRSKGVPMIEMEDVGRAIGRDTHMVACVVDSGFAEMMLRGRTENEL